MDSSQQQEPFSESFLLGDWSVDPADGTLRRAGSTARLEPKVMHVLVILAGNAGRVVSRDEILDSVWPDTFVAEEALTRCISDLRRVLEDDAKDPRYIETVPKRGYRLIAPVSRDTLPSQRAFPRIGWGILAAALIALFGWYVLRERSLSPVSAGITSLVVLPLDNLMDDVQQDYFVEGMHELLITELSRIGALRVISRTSAARYKNTEKQLTEIAGELNVDALVEGSVLRSEDRVRITAQLIGLEPERHLWANSYERELGDILALQREVAHNIAREIRITLTPEEETLLSSSRPVDPEAYQAYLKGRHHWSRRTPEDFEKSLSHFQEAIDRDPTFALALVGLADANILLGGSGVLPSEEAYEKARAALVRAFEIDQRAADAHASMAVIRGWFDWDWAGAEREFQKAMELHPNHARSLHWHSVLLGILGRHDEALAEIRRAQELDPLSSVINASVAGTLLAMRHYEQALEEIRDTMELDPNFGLSLEILAWIYLEKGMHEEAIDALQAWAEVSQDSSESQAELVYAYAAAGQTEKATRIMERLERQANAQYVSPYFIALAHTGLGERDRAFQWLEKAYQEKSGLFPAITGPLWQPLREDPRYEGFLRRLKLPEEAIARHLVR